MAVYLFTFHAYRSWRPDHPRGYTRRGEGVLPPDPEMALRYDRYAKHPVVRFEETGQRAILDCLHSTCAAKQWRLHYACVMPTHVHALVSWTGYAEWNGVRATLKRRMGAALSKTFHRPGPWFSRGGKDSRKQVTDPKHFAYLVETYLPKLTHRGTHYCERRGQWRQ